MFHEYCWDMQTQKREPCTCDTCSNILGRGVWTNSDSSEWINALDRIERCAQCQSNRTMFFFFLKKGLTVQIIDKYLRSYTT